MFARVRVQSADDQTTRAADANAAWPRRSANHLENSLHVQQSGDFTQADMCGDQRARNLVARQHHAVPTALREIRPASRCGRDRERRRRGRPPCGSVRSRPQRPAPAGQPGSRHRTYSWMPRRLPRKWNQATPVRGVTFVGRPRWALGHRTATWAHCCRRHSSVRNGRPSCRPRLATPTDRRNTIGTQH